MDENNNVVGAQPRDVTVRQRLWGRGAYTLLLDSTGTALYVTRRSPHKDVYPGLLDVVTSGVVTAGETYEQTARRELAEELGVCDGVSVALHMPAAFAFVWQDAWCRVHGQAFTARCVGANTALSFADKEVTAGQWLPLHELEQRAANTPADFTPVGLYVLAAWRQRRVALQRAGSSIGRTRRCRAVRSAAHG